MLKRSLFALAALCALSTPAQAQDRAVAVTFDDLPYQAADAVLCDPAQAMALTEDFVGMLRPLETRAAAFVNEGKVCEERRAGLLPALLNVWLDAGLDLGNHTFCHLNIHRNTVETYLDDVDQGAPATRAVLEARGRALRFFRHPFLFTGETTEKKAAIAAGLAGRGYTVAPVTLDNNDWMFAAVYRKAEADGDEALKTRVGEAYVAHMAVVMDHWEPYSAELTGGREPAQVLLLHANTLNRDWYPRIHALYQARGYRFVTLDEALADPVYGHADDYVRANGVSWLHRWTASEGRPIRWEPEPPKWIVDAWEAAN
ncbi:polysaccharide deacetylase family protein [Brevundimonas sp.]|uniref:polysaccharide deacetylase family protein n=1 Tax=Brevundimonas sp. TaxID=1871086 RepID=UPI002D5606C0|nr:polysaccharide deacetylase family protein [Brevundimonas sp.]HYC97160.1 polysaccharide deacetylase family protein [Brevundimonas sp.]